MKTAVVGGGIGGMVTAILLKQDGWDVTLFEKSEKLGGRLTFAHVGKSKIDEGPTIVLLPEILKEMLSQCGLSDLDLHLCDPMYHVHFRDGVTYEKRAPYTKQIAYIQEKFPKEERGFLRFMDDMRETFHTGKPRFLEQDFSERKKFFTPSNLFTLWRLRAYENTKRRAARYFKSEYLQEAYSFQTLYIGGNPYTTPAIYNLISFSEHEHGVWYVKGGYASLVKKLERRMRQLGITVRLGEEVKELIVENEKVTGLRTGQNRFSFDYVVYNGDYPTIKKVLDIEEVQEKKWEPSSGCYLLYLEIDRKYTETELHQFFMSGNTKQHMEEVFEKKCVPTDPSVYIFNPSIIDPTLAPEGHSVLYVLVPVPSGTHIDWHKETAFKEQILDRLEEKEFPNLREHITACEVRTPLEAARDGLYEGGSFGVAPILAQSAAFRPQVKPTNMDNLFAVGASVHPGGGVPIVLMGVKLVIEKLREEALKESVKSHEQQYDGVAKSVPPM